MTHLGYFKNEMLSFTRHHIATNLDEIKSKNSIVWTERRKQVWNNNVMGANDGNVHFEFKRFLLNKNPDDHLSFFFLNSKWVGHHFFITSFSRNEKSRLFTATRMFQKLRLRPIESISPSPCFYSSVFWHDTFDECFRTRPHKRREQDYLKSEVFL